MTTFEIAETWVERNYAKESKEEKEKLTLVFISGMAEGQRIPPHTLEECESEDLEKEIDAYYKEWDGNCRYAQTARHFAEWGAEHLADRNP